MTTGTTGITATLGSVVSTSDTLRVTAATLVSIAVTPVSPSVANDLTKQFTATGTYSDNSTQNLTSLVTWASSNLRVATISASGLASALTPGTAGITATLGTVVSTSDTLTVTPATFNVAAGTSFTVPSGNYAGGTTFNVGAGATVTIDAGTFTGGVVFNLGTGAVVNIIDSPTFSGTLTGGGGGTVQRRQRPTLRRHRWTDAQLRRQHVPVDRRADGSRQREPDQPGHDDHHRHRWTSTTTACSTTSARSSRPAPAICSSARTASFPATLENEAGGCYLLEGDGGLTEISDSGSAPGQTSLINAGIIRKTAGTGTSSLSVSGLDHQHRHHRGRFRDDLARCVAGHQPALRQHADRRHLERRRTAPRSSSPAARPSPATRPGWHSAGAGRRITGIAGLASNSGTFTVTNGAHFTTAGDFTNSGSLTVGPGSILTVAGNFTQTSTGTLNDQIGGTPASGLFGQVDVTGTATLAGTFNLTLVNGFSPSSGQTFDVMSFASATGNFTSFSGLSPFFTESLGSTGLDLDGCRDPGG